MDNRKLLDALRDGLPLTRRPFESIGRACGASEDEVLDRLRRLRDNGGLVLLAPMPAVPPARAGAAGASAPDEFDARLLALLASGIPLLPYPYEAIAATLDSTEAEVLGRLGALLDAGLAGRIRMQPRMAEPGSPDGAS